VPRRQAATGRFEDQILRHALQYPIQASKVRTIQPATADGSIASMRSIIPP
jgi:hypothetical protein